MNCVAGGERADCIYTARRNNSLSSSARLLVFGFILIVSLGIAAAFSLIFGAWPIMPYAAIEMVVLYFAFRYIDRHAGDYERVTIRGDNVSIEVHEGKNVTHFELQRYWVRVACDADGERLVLRSHGREVEIGRNLSGAQRLGMARELAREIGRAA